MSTVKRSEVIEAAPDCPEAVEGSLVCGNVRAEYRSKAAARNGEETDSVITKKEADGTTSSGVSPTLLICVGRGQIIR